MTVQDNPYRAEATSVAPKEEGTPSWVLVRRLALSTLRMGLTALGLAGGVICAWFLIAINTSIRNPYLLLALALTVYISVAAAWTIAWSRVKGSRHRRPYRQARARGKVERS